MSVRYRNPSLWWKLSWQIGLVIFAVIMAVIVGLSVYATMVLSPNVGVEHRVKSAISGAIVRDTSGQLHLGDSPGLHDLKAQNSGFWFVAATPERSFASYGPIPPDYADLAPFTHLFRAADIRGSASVDQIASVKTATTETGEIRIMFGGLAGRGWPLLAILKDSWPIYGSLLTIALPAIFFAVPQLVRRALKGIGDTASKASEIDLRRYGTRLPTADIPAEIIPLVNAFNGTLDRLEDSYKKRQHFLIDAAHELRTPIAIMQTRIDGMADGQGRERLLRDVARLADTAEQLLDFERNDQAPDVDQTVDLVDITRRIVADLAPLAITAGYEIAFENEPDGVIRKGSPTALPRAISNVVRNAIDHGGGSGLISISVSTTGCITVRDQGPGIASEHQDLVFEPFYRVAPKSEGAGLGLSLVKQIVTNHGGEVTLDSSAKGTTVMLRL